MVSQHRFLPHFYFCLLGLLLSPPSSVLALLPASKISQASFSQTQLSVATAANKVVQNCSADEIQSFINTTFTNPNWRKDAPSQLAKKCGQSAVLALIKVLQTNPNVKVQESAAQALALIGGATATEALVDAFKKTNGDISVRETVAKGLGTARVTTAIKLLIATLNQQGEKMRVREAAAKALGMIGGASVINPLMDIMKDINQQADLRLAAAEALGAVKDSAVDALVTALNDPDLKTRYWAVEALRAINSPRASNALKENQPKVTQIEKDAEDKGLNSWRAPGGKVRKGIKIKLPQGPKQPPPPPPPPQQSR